MKSTKLLWMTFIAVSYVGTTAEARVRKPKMLKDGVQNQQPQYEYENGDYDNGDYHYTDYEEKNNRKYRDIKLFYLLLTLFFCYLVDPDLNPVSPSEPPDEIPRNPVTVPSREPDNETPVPTGTVSLHIIPTTPPPVPSPLPTLPPPSLPSASVPDSDSHAAAFSCSYEGKFYREGQNWRPTPCTNCSCLSREIVCKVIPNCVTRK